MTLPLMSFCSKTSQRNKQIAMGRKKFNMDPKKVGGQEGWDALVLDYGLSGAEVGSGAGGLRGCGGQWFPFVSSALPKHRPV